MRKLNKNNGITLIALVITIVVMLILVAVSISMAVNGELFGYAGKARGDTKNAIDAEQELSNGRIQVDGVWYDTIDKYIAKEPSENQGEETDPDTGMKSYNDTEKDSTTGVLKANATYESGEYTAVIPKGFKIIPGINNTTTIAEGLVIQDAEGNEFVWIPVKVLKEGEKKDSETSIASFYRSDWVTNEATGGKRGTALSIEYTEPYASGYSDGNGTEELKDYKDMLKSVYINEGFYIGRYEAGIKTTGSPRTSSTTTTTENWVVQRDCYPYNYVGWGKSMTDYTSEIKDQGKGALALSKEMYKNKDVGVTSTLCYGIQWDAMLDFIKDDDHDVTNGLTWGNYYDNTGDTWKITRENVKWTTNPGSDTKWTTVGENPKEKTNPSYTLLTTGANDNFSAKNIYDVAGNVYEWTNEAYSTNQRVIRGGYYGSYISKDGYPASGRYACNLIGFEYRLGFRPVLYITNNK